MHSRWSVVRNVLEGFVIGIELTQSSDSTAGDNVLHMTDGSSGGTTHHAVTALWSYVWTSQHDLTFSGNTIDGALDPSYTATAFPTGGYPAILVWARTENVLTLTHWSIGLDFAGLAGTGSLVVEPTTGTPTEPKGFLAIPGAFYFELATTGTVAFDSVRICIPYAAGLTVVPHLYHYHADWADVTDSTSGEIAAHVVCGTVDSFSGVIVGVTDGTGPGCTPSPA